jgi:hypothetical protein
VAAVRTVALLCAVVAAACAPDPHHEVSASGAGAYEPSLAVFSDGFAVAWYDTRDGYGQIYERALDASGQPAGPEIRLTNSRYDAYEADIHPIEALPPGGSFVVGWYEKTPTGMVPYLGVWSRNGAARWMQALAARGRNTVVRVSGTSIYAAWIVDETDPRASVWAGWWNADGKIIVAPRRIADAGKTTYNLNAALGPNDAHGLPEALLVLDATAGTRADEVFLVEDDGAHAQVTRLTPDDGHASKYPDLALSGTRTALTWFDTKDGNEEVYLRVGSRSDLAQPDALTGARVTSTKGHSIGAYAAWNGDRVGLAWCDDTPGQHEVYFAEFDAAGAPQGEPRRLTDTRAGSLIPSIHPWRDGFVLAWNEYEGPGGHEEGGRSQVLVRLITGERP